MLEDFKRALGRVQSDYGFYIDCQVNPAMALADYDLSVEERSALIDSEKLAGVLKHGEGISKRWSIIIKICGTHDWVNRAMPENASGADPDHGSHIRHNVNAIRSAQTSEERTDAVVRLMELIG